MSGNLHAGLSATDLVSELYRLCFRRQTDPGAADKVRRLEDGTATVESLLEELLGSAEYAAMPALPPRFMEDHSQYGELGILLRQALAGATSNMIVVDVGARGRDRSNAYDLLKQFGWRGLLIEANPDLIAGIQRDFAGLDVEILPFAVSDYDGEATFYLGQNDDVSSLTKSAALGWGPLTGEVTVPVRRLGPLLRGRDIPTDFGLLSIDIEGEDIRVLNDVVAQDGYRPLWVVIEASHDFATRSLDDLPFHDLVRRHYRLVGQTAANLILERVNDPAIAPG